MTGSLSHPLKFVLHLLIGIVTCKGSQEDIFLIKIVELEDKIIITS